MDRNYPATLFSESGSDMFFCFHSYPDCAKRLNMVVVKHIRDLLAVNSMAEMTDSVMTLLDQVAKLNEKNSLLTEQNSRLTEQKSQVTEQLSLVNEQNARLQEENTALVQRIS